MRRLEKGKRLAGNVQPPRLAYLMRRMRSLNENRRGMVGHDVDPVSRRKYRQLLEKSVEAMCQVSMMLLSLRTKYPCRRRNNVIQ